MDTECSDTAHGTDAWIVSPQSASGQITNRTSEAEATDDRDLWMPMPPPNQQPIWPRVWPGL